jgi:hypothetical protein
LTYHIGHRVRHLNSGNGDISDVFKHGRDDDIPDILDKMLLELDIAVLVAAEVLKQLLQRVAKGLVVRILVELGTKELDLVQDAISMAPVAVTEKELAMLSQFIVLAAPVILHDVALLLQSFAKMDIRIVHKRNSFF